jgi:hypothetical protein
MSDEKRDETVAPVTANTTAPIASDHVIKDHAVPNGDVEKDNILQQEHTHSDAGTPNSDLKNELTLHDTIDLNNTHAFKGDDSDGKIEWTFKKVSNTFSGRWNIWLIFATACCILLFSYVVYW